MTPNLKSAPEVAETDFLSTIPSERAFNPWDVLGQFDSQPVVLVAIAIEPRGTRTGRLEERGAWLQELWYKTLTQMPTLHGSRLGWDTVFFIVDTPDVEKTQALFQPLLASLRDLELESRCILALTEGGPPERGQLLCEMQHDLTATDVGGYARFPHRLRDGISWPGK